MVDQQYLVLARKWRPQRFEDVVGQEHITRTLRNAIASGRIHHAFLFIGSRGIGKTTTARILAKALNCLESDAPTPEPCGVCDNCTSISSGSNIDVIEIDGASNNGVDDVRELRENIRMVPSLGRYKVYIIDEVHQLSIGAFNALLKTLEEPPPHAVFVLATTESHKIPATIVSRCQRYDFRRVPIPAIIELLEKILETEGIKAEKEALHAIARAAEGGIRDAESTLDELITYCDGEITFKDVNDVLGLIDWRLLHSLSEGILNHDVFRLLTLIDEIVSAGKDLSQFVQEVLFFFRNLLICKTTQDTNILHLPEDELKEIKEHSARYPLTHLVRLVEQFAELSSGFDSQLAQRIALEALLIRVAKISTEVSIDSVMEKLIALGAGGIPDSDRKTTTNPEQAPPPTDPPEAGPVTSRAPAVPAETGRKQLSDHVTSVEESDAAVLYAQTNEANEPNDIPDATSSDANQTIHSTTPLPLANDNAAQPEDSFETASDALEFEDPTSFDIETTAHALQGMPGRHENMEIIKKSGVTPEEIEMYMNIPGIAQVVDIFKGKIVSIRHKAIHDTGTISKNS